MLRSTCVVHVPLLLSLFAPVVPGSGTDVHGSGLDPRDLPGEFDPERIPTVITGQVLDPDGHPVFGAVVVTSAGGQAVTEANGAYRLEVVLPKKSTSLQVVAVGGAPSASARMLVDTGPFNGGVVQAGRLQLQLGAGCEPSWLSTFGGAPGVNGVVFAMTVFDDGGGPALYAGGSFESAGGVPASHVAKWDGTHWSELDTGMDGYVLALTVFDDGGGPALYAGGYFTTAGGVAVNQVAKWSGSSWSALGGGMNGAVLSLTVFDDGGGPALYAGGGFTSAGGVPADRLAKWDGSSWTALGSGMDSRVQALTVFDDGGGQALYAGGEFTSAGGVAADHIAKWDGSSWSELDTGVDGHVHVLTVFDDGGGPVLYAGGGFTSAGGGTANCIAKWDGALWSPLGSGMAGGSPLPDVSELSVFDDGNGPALYAGGDFTSAGGVATNNIAKWDGSSWSAFASGTSLFVRALAVFDDGGGPALFAGGGGIQTVGGIAVNNIAKWDGSGWLPLGIGMNESASALAVFDDGGGPALYVGGDFTSAGGVTASYIAKWDGSSWTALGAGMDEGTVRSLAVFDDGNGPALYAGGDFSWSGGVLLNGIARWDGSGWTGLGTGLSGFFGKSVYALEVFDDGGGPALYVGGGFEKAGGVAANGIARWDGSSWTAVDSGVSFAAVVSALKVFDDGGGPALYAGGDFTSAGGAAASYIARWDGTLWSPVGTGVSGGGPLSGVRALEVFDDGGGPALYVGGEFTTAGGMATSNVAKWDGSSWAALGSGMDSRVQALTVYDDGGGRALYAGGDFTSAGGVAVSYIAKWDGSSWSALNSLMDDGVLGLAVHDDGVGPALYVGGSFTVSHSGDSHVAKWGGCTGPRSYCTAGFSASGCQALLSAAGTASATASSGFDLLSSGVEGQKNGIYYFGTSGRQANPWGNGTSLQCVVPPVRRAGLLIGSGTSGLCDGNFSQDLNALWCPTCPKPQKNPGAGAVVQAQLWYRDPKNTSNQTTSLSDAIEFMVGP